MDSAQIFISYARADDAPPPDAPTKKGFVSNLCAFLGQSFPKSPTSPRMWRDVGEVGPAHQFDAKIEKALEASRLFLAVLSENWLESEYCGKELAYFSEFWRKRGVCDE